jgi:hypothetical protein
MSNPPDLMTLESPLSTRPPAPDSSTGSSAGSEPPAHLEAALAAAEGATAGASAETAPAVMPRAEWCDLYLKCHGIAGQAIGSRVLIGVPERKGGLEAAGAIYDTILDTPVLHFLIHPGGVWFQRASLVAFFYIPVIAEVRAERAPRKTPRAPAPRDPAETGGLAMPPDGAQ